MSAETKPGREPDASAFPREIWLQHPADADPEVGQLWAEDDPFDGGHPAARYVLASVSAVPAPAGCEVREAERGLIQDVNQKTTFSPAFFADVGRDPTKWVAALRVRIGSDAACDQVLLDFFQAALATPVSAEEDGLRAAIAPIIAAVELHDSNAHGRSKGDETPIWIAIGDWKSTPLAAGPVVTLGDMRRIASAALTPTPVESAARGEQP